MIYVHKIEKLKSIVNVIQKIYIELIAHYTM